MKVEASQVEITITQVRVSLYEAAELYETHSVLRDQLREHVRGIVCLDCEGEGTADGDPECDECVYLDEQGPCGSHHCPIQYPAACESCGGEGRIIGQYCSIETRARVERFWEAA